MHDVTNIFSDRLKKLRGDKSLQEVADAIGISRVSLGYYETGKRTPDIDVLYKIAAYYEVSADYLIGCSDVKANDIDIQAIAQKTGLSELAIIKIFRWNTKFKDRIKSLNELLQIDEFSLVLHRIDIYMELVKEMMNLSDFSDEMKTDRYKNFVYRDNNMPPDWAMHVMDTENFMLAMEYSVDKTFRNVIQELEKAARNESI